MGLIPVARKNLGKQRAALDIVVSTIDKLTVGVFGCS